MTSTRRYAALVLSFSFGFGAPLVALATVPEGASEETAGFHSSSRVLAYHAAASQDEMEELRVRLWALTENGAPQCNVDGVAVSCDAISAE